MSSQKGNMSRSRSQKHQNTRAYKNDLYDKSKRTKVINDTQITSVCERCKAILEWKIKYKKYKLLKNPSTCCKCHNKCVKQPYHTICELCSDKLKLCPKCGKDRGVTNEATEGPNSESLKELELNSGEEDFDDEDSASFSDD